MIDTHTRCGAERPPLYHVGGSRWEFRRLVV